MSASCASSSSSRREATKALIDGAIARALDRLGGRDRYAFRELVWGVQSRSSLIRPGHCVNRARPDRLDQILAGLVALIDRRRHWLRPVGDWVPAGSGPLAQFSTLAHHLLAHYPTPPVLLSGWFRERWCPWGRAARDCFRHVGLGGSLRTAGLPIPMTRRMAHEFAHARADVPIEFALRWAQARGLGASEPLARAWASTRLAGVTDGDEFWTTVLHFFRNQPRLDLAHVGPIVDDLYGRKFGPGRVVLGEGEDEVTFNDPPEPDFSIKGRTLASLLRLVADRRAALLAASKAAPAPTVLRWDRSAIGEYGHPGEGGPRPTIRELLDSDAMLAEGKAMRHCVATYTLRCSRRRTTIWSLGLEDEAERHRLLTIEVDPATRRVVQAKMADNAAPDDLCRSHLAAWAAAERLTLAE